MRVKNPETKVKLLDYINGFYDENHKNPTLRQIEAAVGISRQTAMRYLKEMSEEGAISYDAKNIVTEHIKEKFETSSFKLPLYGAVPCGVPESEEEQHHTYIEVPLAFVGKGEYYGLIAEGNSMINVGIDDGDIIIVRRTAEAKKGQFVVALAEENRSTLKRLCYTENGVPYLHPENSDYGDIYPKELIIQGVAEKVIKDLTRYE